MFKSWLNDNDIEMYSVHNKGNAVVIERFNRTLKEWMWKYFSAYNTRKYVNVLDGVLELYNSRKHRSVRMTPSEASLSKNEGQVYHNLYGAIHVSFPEAKYDVGDKVRISKQKGKFEKGYTPRWTEEIFEIDKVQYTNPETYKIKDLNGEEIDGSFYKENSRKQVKRYLE